MATAVDRVSFANAMFPSDLSNSNSDHANSDDDDILNDDICHLSDRPSSDEALRSNAVKDFQ